MKNYMQAAAMGGGINYPATALGGPRRMFGSYDQGASIPVNALTPGMFADDLLGYGLDEQSEHGDPKRRRIARVRLYCFAVCCKLTQA
jgi:hypothetical protein